MKILYYSPNPHLKLNAHNGPGTHIREMIEAMRELGHDVLPVVMGDTIHSGNSTTISSSNKSSLKKNLKKIIPGFIWRTLKDYKLIQFDKGAELILEKNIKVFQPDMVYERAAYLQLSGIRSLKNKNIPHYIEINAPLVEETKVFENAFSLFNRKAVFTEKQLVSAPEKVFVVSSALKKYYSKYTKNPDKIVLTPNCVNISKIIIDTSLTTTLINKYNLQGKKIIGFVGSIFPYHGVDILIKAFAETCKKYDNLCLMIVGDGAIISELKFLCEKLAIHKNVVFTGSVDHDKVFTYIDLMDIAVMAKSNWYGSPVKIFEYGAMKKAIIAPNTIPVRDVMINEEDGFLIEPDSTSLSNAFNKLLDDETLKNKLAENFHKKVIINFNWINTAKKVLG